MADKMIAVRVVKGFQGKERVECNHDPTLVTGGEIVVWTSVDGDFRVVFKADDPFEETPKVWQGRKDGFSNVGTVRRNADHGSYFYTVTVSNRPQSKPDVQSDPEIVVT